MRLGASVTVDTCAGDAGGWVTLLSAYDPVPNPPPVPPLPSPLTVQHRSHVFIDSTASGRIVVESSSTHHRRIIVVEAVVNTGLGMVQVDFCADAGYPPKSTPFFQ